MTSGNSINPMFNDDLWFVAKPSPATANLAIPDSQPKLQTNPAERIFPQNVQYSGDIFEKPNNNILKDNILKVSDGGKYNIFSVMTQRINHAIRCINDYIDQLDIITRFSTPDNSLLISEIAEEYDKAINNNPVNDAFYRLTGLEYNEENAEKFINGKIKLKIELTAEEYTKKELKLPPVEPYISEYYLNQKVLENMKNARTEMNKSETIKYNIIKSKISSEYQTKLVNALKNGQLLQDNSDNKTTVLESLYKILTTPRADNLDGKQIVEECIDILDNPYVITQSAEDIPEEYQEECTERLVAHEMKMYERRLEDYNKSVAEMLTLQADFEKMTPEAQRLTMEQMSAPIPSPIIITEETARNSVEQRQDELFNYRNVNTCAAASIEFYLASQHPAQFFKMVEELTSEQKSFMKNVNWNNLNNENFHTDCTIIDKKNAIVKITADENAYLLAKIQTKHKDENERSIVDIIMQSTIMNLGSGGTYESIGDRYGLTSYKCYDFAESGLKAEMAEFVLDILCDDNIECSIYKDYDYKANKLKDMYNPADIKNEILDALNRKGSVVAGFCWNDAITGICGHEITIIGYTTNMNGDGFFIIQDSDDSESKPALWEEKSCLEMLHHAFI